MQAGKALKTAAAFMLSEAMLATGAACGTSDDSDAAASKSSSKSSELTGYDVSGVKKDDAIAKMLPDYVTKDGKLTIGMDTSYAPAEFLAADGKTPVGFDVDIVKALAKTFGLEADPQTSNFDSIIPSIGSKYDIGVSSFTITPERMKAVDFVSMFKAGSTWVVKKGNPNKVDTSDLCGLKIAVQTGTTQEEEVNKGAEQCKADNKLDIQILSNKLQTDVTTAVASGKADIFYADTPVAGYAIKQTGDTLEALGEDVGVTPAAVAVKKGDVFVVTTTVGNSTYEKSAYFYNGKAWVAMTGNVDADKVILRENITLAGGYTQVGNLTKSQNGTATFASKCKSVMDALTEIFSKRLQPSITAQPSIGTFTQAGAGAVAAGTKVATAAYSGATLNAGSYQYGPATGGTATNWKVERITNAATTQVTTADAASLTAGSDNNGGAGFIIGDAGDNAVSSLKYRVTATHGAGVTAKDNLGADSSPVVAIAAGSKTKDTAAYTPFRNVFYGTSADKPALDSAAIRALGKTGKAYAASTLTINVPVGAQRVAIACIATAKGVTKVINETAMNADVTSTFTKSTVSVEGANGYAAKDYNVWVFEPAVAYGNAAVLKVTLG